MTPRDMRKQHLVNLGIEISRVPCVAFGFGHLCISEFEGSR